MALDKETILKAVQQIDPQVLDVPAHIESLSQAIYEIGYGDGASNDINVQTNYNRGVQAERERAALEGE